MQDWWRRRGTPPDGEPGDLDEDEDEDEDEEEPDEPSPPETCNRASASQPLAAIRHAPRPCQ